MSDALLEWMSFRGSGSLADIPTSLLPSRSRRTLSDLGALGHIEVDGRDKWRIAPPIVACLPDGSEMEAVAIVCGARTAGVRKHLNEACLSPDTRIVVIQREGLPSAIRLSAPSYATLAEAAARAGMHFQYQAGYSLLACVPSIASWPRQPCQMVGGRVEIVRRFSGSRAHWIVSSLEEAQSAAKGLFRIKRDYDWVSILKSGPADCTYIDDRAGRMLTAAKRRHAAWNAQTQIFSLPANLFPPMLIARALVLCSGHPPALDRVNGRILFAGIDAQMIRLTLAITGLRLA